MSRTARVVAGVLVGNAALSYVFSVAVRRPVSFVAFPSFGFAAILQLLYIPIVLFVLERRGAKESAQAVRRGAWITVGLAVAELVLAGVLISISDVSRKH